MGRIGRIVSLALGFALFVPVLLLAQEAAPAMPDVTQSVVSLIAAVGVIVIPFIAYGVTLLAPRMPKILIPVLVYGLGGVVSVIDSAVSGGQFSPILAALVGFGAHALREVVTTLQKHGVSG